MIRNWKICMAERWFGSAAIVASPNAPPSRQQARHGPASAASCPADIRTPNASANPTMQIPWNTATSVSPATFPATRVSRDTGVTNSSREKSFSRSSTIEIIPAAADWNRLAASTPVNASVTAFRPVTRPTVGCRTAPSPPISRTGNARVTASLGRSRSSLVTSRWAMAATPDSSWASTASAPLDELQVGVLQRRAELARLDLIGAAAFDDPALDQHAHRVGGFRLGQVVRGQEYRGPQRHPGLCQVSPQAAPALRVQASGRLIKEQHGGPVHERPDDLQPAPLPSGQGPDMSPEQIGEIQNVSHVLYLAAVAGRHQPVRRPPGVEPVEHGVQPDVLLGGQVEVERRLLEHHAEFPADLALLHGQVQAGDPDPARGRGQGRGEHRHRGRLPRAVGPEQAEQLALGHGEADPVDGVARGAPVALDQVIDRDRGHLPAPGRSRAPGDSTPRSRRYRASSPHRPASQAAGRMTALTRAAGRYGARTSRSKSRMNSASSTGLGTMRAAACWAWAMAAAVSSSSCMLSAGQGCTATLAGRGPAFAKWCTVAGGTSTVSPGPAVIRRPPTRNRIRPSSTVKHSSCSGWAWLLGTRPPGASRSSHSRTLRRSSAAVARIVIRSPLSGVTMTAGPPACSADIARHRGPVGQQREHQGHRGEQRHGGGERECGRRGLRVMSWAE